MRKIVLLLAVLFAGGVEADWLVKLRSGVSSQSLRLQLNSLDVSVMREFQLVPGLLRVSGGEAEIAEIRKLPEVLYVEKNSFRRPTIYSQTIPPEYINKNLVETPAAKVAPPIPPAVARPVTWVKTKNETNNTGLYQSRTKEIFEKRKFYGSENIIIAILDTGVDYTHRDLLANMWRNPGETGTDSSGLSRETNGIDDDGNGFVDDVVGYDFGSDKSKPYDDHGHGTHVAGIAAAVGGDGWGITGHCPRCSIMALKFITAEGFGTDADAIEGLEYAAKMGAHVINSSWGGEEFSQSLYDAFVATSELGIVNVVAAGNSGINLSFGIPNQYPAEFQIPGLYTIAALYEVNAIIAWWSNYGTPYTDFSVVGDGVSSCVPGNKHARMSGTSMASPGAAGMIGLILSYRPNLNFDGITEAVRNNIIADRRSLSGTNFRGRPNMEKAFNWLDKNTSP